MLSDPEKAVDAVVHAIMHRRHLSFQYKGRFRRVMPMIFGRSRDGAWRLRAIQIGGTSASGKPGDGRPRVFNLLEMSDVELHDTTFKVPRQYAPDDEDLIIHQEVRLRFRDIE